MPKMISANDLATGAVLYLGPLGTWVARVEQAAAYADDAAAEQGLVVARRDVGRNIVVDPFVTERGGDGAPGMTLRDVIRANGPTIDYRPS